MPMLWVWYGLASAVFYAAGGLIGKHVMRRKHALEYAGSQGLYGLLLVLLLPFIDLRLSAGTYITLYLISIVVAAGNLYYLKSIRHSELSSTVPLMNISPIFLLIIAYLLLGEAPSGLAILGVVLLVAGTYVVQIAASDRRSLLAPFKALWRSRYAMYMIFAVFVFSLSATMQKAVVNWGIPVLSILILTRLFISINYVALETIEHGFTEMRDDVRKQGWSIFASMAVGFFSDLFLILAMAVPGALVSLVIPMKRTSTFLTALIGGKLFKERHVGLKLLGCAVMLAGVLLIAL